MKIKKPILWEFIRKLLEKYPEGNGRILLVGGSVRDQFVALEYPKLGIHPSLDLDIVVEKEGGAKLLAEFLHQALPNETEKPHELGRGYPIWQVVFHSAQFGEVEIQIADTQSEMFPDPKTRQRITRYGTLEEDTQRRDFTVNMLYFDLRKDEALDPSGVGRDDIRKGILRGHPQVETRKIFSEDPLRMLRLLRFQARFGWEIDPRTWQALQDEFHRVNILSAERVRDELIKICITGGFADVLEKLQSSGLLGHLIPEALPMVGCGQDSHYHSEGDVWVHTLSVMRHAPATPLLQLAALLHDWGKPDTRADREDGRVTFLNHEKFSTDKSRIWLKKWRFPKKLSEDVLQLVALHLRGGDVVAWKSLKPARKLLRESGDLIEPLLELILADSSASLGPDGKARTEHVPLLREKIKEASLIQAVPRNVLSGKKIMDHFALPAGPEVKRLKDIAEDVYDEALLSGKVLDEAELLKLLKSKL